MVHALRSHLAYFFLFMGALRHTLRSGDRYDTLVILYLSKEQTRYIHISVSGWHAIDITIDVGTSMSMDLTLA